MFKNNELAIFGGLLQLDGVFGVVPNADWFKDPEELDRGITILRHFGNTSKSFTSPEMEIAELAENIKFKLLS